jgi:hypothetical protein
VRVVFIGVCSVRVGGGGYCCCGDVFDVGSVCDGQLAYNGEGEGNENFCDVVGYYRKRSRTTRRCLCVAVRAAVM